VFIQVICLAARPPWLRALLDRLEACHHQSLKLPRKTALPGLKWSLPSWCSPGLTFNITGISYSISCDDYGTLRVRDTPVLFNYLEQQALRIGPWDMHETCLIVELVFGAGPWPLLGLCQLGRASVTGGTTSYNTQSCLFSSYAWLECPVPLCFHTAMLSHLL